MRCVKLMGSLKLFRKIWKILKFFMDNVTVINDDVFLKQSNKIFRRRVSEMNGKSKKFIYRKKFLLF